MADSNAWRQPMVFGLIRYLSSRFQVEIVSLKDQSLQFFEMPSVKVQLLDRKNGVPLLLRIVRRLFLELHRLIQWSLPQCAFAPRAPEVAAMVTLSAHLRKRKGAEAIIAIDCTAALAAQLAGKNPSLFLLEMLQHNICHLALRDTRLHSVATQSRLRYLAAFPKGTIPFSFVPNFPPYKERRIPENKKGFVFAGTAIPGFGAVRCLDFALKHPDVTLHFRGAAPPWLRSLLGSTPYESLISNGRVVIEDGFLQEEEYLAELAKYRIGFAFYDLEESDKSFFAPDMGIAPFSVQNYMLGAAGKVGSCCAAGVPIIANDLPGMSYIREHGAGILIGRMDPESIYKAAQEIESRYEEFSRNCIKLAKAYCLDKHLEKYAEMVTDSPRV